MNAVSRYRAVCKICHLEMESFEPITDLTCVRCQARTPLWPWESAMLKEIKVGQTMCELGAKQYGAYKAFFQRCGLRHVSIDLNGMGQALALDLQEPLDVPGIGGPFDWVTNFGTTEHVQDQPAVWANVHRLLKVGGVLVSQTPYPGDWKNHGRWYVTKSWYQELCHLNGYEIDTMLTACNVPQRLVCLKAIKRHDSPFLFPQAPLYDNEGGKVGAYV